MATPQKSFG